MKLLRNIQIQFFLFSAFVGALIGILGLIFPQLIHEKIWNIYFFILILSLVISIMSGLLLKSFSENFFNIMVLGTVLRFIASLVFITIVVLPGIQNIILFIGDFFTIFLFYLVFDIYAFLSNLRPISK
jgi:hypothetical protein